MENGFQIPLPNSHSHPLLMALLLIVPARSEGNRRMFSLDDIDALLEIRELLDQGINMAGIKKVFAMRNDTYVRSTDIVQMSDAELRSILREEMQQAQASKKTSLRQGDLSRFFQYKNEQ